MPKIEIQPHSQFLDQIINMWFKNKLSLSAISENFKVETKLNFSVFNSKTCWIIDVYLCNVSQFHSLQCKHIGILIKNPFLDLSIPNINMISLQSVKNYVFVKKKY